MAISSELSKEIIGASDSATARLLAMRRAPGDGELSRGVWYSGFARVKAEAEMRKLPLFALWTNGERCTFCKRFMMNLLDPLFLSVMQKSNALWWFGGSMDDNTDDGRDGAGYTWCQGPGRKVGMFPFFATYYTADGGRTSRSFFGSGSDWDLGKAPPEGATHIVDKIAKVYGVPTIAERGTAGGCSGFLHIRFNSSWDARHIARFQEALKGNGGYCLCQPKSPDTVCTCRSFMEQTEPGLCHCGAFEKFTV